MLWNKNVRLFNPGPYHFQEGFMLVSRHCVLGLYNNPIQRPASTKDDNFVDVIILEEQALY